MEIASPVEVVSISEVASPLEVVPRLEGVWVMRLGWELESWSSSC